MAARLVFMIGVGLAVGVVRVTGSWVSTGSVQLAETAGTPGDPEPSRTIMPLDTSPAASGTLSARALSTLRTYFDQRNHRPSEAHWQALRDIAATIQAMADGTATPNIFLSSCDCGAGKTQTAVHCLRQLMADASYAGVGVIVCVGRIAEAVAFAEALADEPDERRAVIGKIAVATSRTDANQKSTTGLYGTAIEQRSDIDNAQVLIVTQQKIERIIGTSLFAEAEAFFYRGKSRQVRIWDEAWLPGVPVSVNRDDLGAALRPLGMCSGEMRAAVEDLFDQVRKLPSGALVDIPDWEALFDLSLYGALSAAAGGGEHARDAITGLYAMSGKAARVQHDDRIGGSALTYRDTLPPDLMPLLVLDASGRVRHVYEDMQRHRGVVPLARAAKNYSPLTVHVWQTGGGKNAWQERGQELLQGIVVTILRKPTERWLIVHHRAGFKIPDVPKEIARQLPADVAARVDFVQWGSHQASNKWHDVPNVILAGTLFMRPSFYVAMTYLGKDKSIDAALTKEDIKRVTLGEHKHLILQAIGRGRVRKLDGDRCGPMDAYLIASAKSGIKEGLTDVFPGCTVRRWEPVEPKLTGKVLEAVNMLDSLLSIGLPEIKETTIRDAIKLDSGSWATRIVKDPQWHEELAKRGITRHAGSGRRPTVLRLDGPWVIAEPDDVVWPDAA